MLQNMNTQTQANESYQRLTESQFVNLELLLLKLEFKRLKENGLNIMHN